MRLLATVLLVALAWAPGVVDADDARSTTPRPPTKTDRADDTGTKVEEKAAETPKSDEAAPVAEAPAKEEKADAPKPMARPYLWVLETQPRVFFCGTIHLPDPRVLAQPETVYAALDASEIVLTEIDLRAPDLKAAGRIMRLPTGHLLSRMLPRKLYDRTAAILANNDVDIKTLEHTKIWAVTFRLQFSKKATAGSSTDQPVQSMDAALSSRAQAAGKEIAGIESMEEQLRIFDNLDLNEQIQMLRSAVESIEGAAKGQPSSMESLIDVYLKGDENELYRYLCADLDPDDSACCFMRKILDGRNVRMLNRVFDRRRAAPGKTLFVAVGAGHYPGREGMLALLKRRGYRVRRVESLAELEVTAPSPEPAAYYESSRVVPYTPRARRRMRRSFPFPFFGPRRCR